MLETPRVMPLCLSNMLVRLQHCDVIVAYRPGKTHYIAYNLSPAPCVDVSVQTACFDEQVVHHLIWHSKCRNGICLRKKTYAKSTVSG